MSKISLLCEWRSNLKLTNSEYISERKPSSFKKQILRTHKGNTYNCNTPVLMPEANTLDKTKQPRSFHQNLISPKELV